MRIFKAHVIGLIGRGNTVYLNVDQITNWHEETNVWENPDGTIGGETYTRVYISSGHSYYTEIKPSLLGAHLREIK